MIAPLVHVAGRLAGAPPVPLGTATSLSAAADHAVRSIRGSQAPDGFWRTPVTVGPRFERPVDEVNVFTPAILIDLLGPVAEELGLREALDRARVYLERQIEATGLVRYHGDPGPVPAGQRGCELPADADDTSLVWRIAPRDDPAQLQAARRELERYRRDGLYLTWFDDGYQCFHSRYAGTDPNPADVLVQVHVYLFLAGQDARAAGELCRALQARMADPRIWVWYTVAPVLPVAREADMARAGCPIRVPDDRIARAVPGQERYLVLGRLLGDLLVGREPSPGTVVDALRRGAESGFQAFATAPPLIYHNDLTATPPHYHWSPEVGFALWLRLYVEAGRRWPREVPLTGR